MIHLQFNETVKVHSLRFVGFNLDAFDAEMAPKVVKLFVNRPSMAFSDCEDVQVRRLVTLLEGLRVNAARA